MEFDAQKPESWSDQEWLTFLLLNAADADGVQHARELRLLRMELGPETVARMFTVHEGMPPEKRAEVLEKSLPVRLPDQASRAKVQQVLRRIVMADGEYSSEEQSWLKRVSDWLRQ